MIGKRSAEMLQFHGCSHRHNKLLAAAAATEKAPIERRRFAVQLLPLLTLTVYAAFSVARFLPSVRDPPLQLHHLADPSFTRVIANDVGGDGDEDGGAGILRRTHILSIDSQLEAHQENSQSSNSEVTATTQSTSSSSSFCSAAFKDARGTAATMLCCDRSQFRTDVCYLRGDIRTDSATSSILLYGAGAGAGAETIRPYTRKWETEIMKTITGVTIRPMDDGDTTAAECEVDHRGVPAVMFSTSGYTGNVYHEFNDGLIPLYITASELQQGSGGGGGYSNEVALVVANYHPWWYTRYEGVIQELTNYEPVDFERDTRVYCFSEMIVGMNIHGELTIDPNLMPKGRGMQEFQEILDRGFGSGDVLPVPPLKSCNVAAGDDDDAALEAATTKPKMLIFVRSKSRMLKNVREVTRWCKRIGFEVHLMNPTRSTPMAKIHSAVSGASAVVVVHGAAATHLLFMRPGSVLIQIVPLGLDWAAGEYYGGPARRLGLEYMEYRVSPRESSLHNEYAGDDPVLVDPSSVTSKGWSETKKVYLDRQDVRVDINSFGKLLDRAYSHVSCAAAASNNTTKLLYSQL